MNLDDLVTVEESRAILLDLLVNSLGQHRRAARDEPACNPPRTDDDPYDAAMPQLTP